MILQEVFYMLMYQDIIHGMQPEENGNAELKEVLFIIGPVLNLEVL